MQVFECESCGTADTITATPQTGVGYRCHECLNGEWHHEFSKETYDFDKHGPALNKVNPDDGFTSFS